MSGCLKERMVLLTCRRIGIQIKRDATLRDVKVPYLNSVFANCTFGHFLNVVSVIVNILLNVILNMSLQ